MNDRFKLTVSFLGLLVFGLGIRSAGIMLLNFWQKFTFDVFGSIKLFDFLVDEFFIYTVGMVMGVFMIKIYRKEDKYFCGEKTCTLTTDIFSKISSVAGILTFIVGGFGFALRISHSFFK